MGVDLGNYAEKPTSTSDGSEQCFADQVPLALRVSLKHEVSKQPFDEIQFMGKEEGERPWKMTDNIQGQKVFHPKLVKATKLQAEMYEVEGKARRPTKEEAEAVIDPQIEVLHELQTGALSVDDDKAKSAQVLRHLDLDRFRTLLKRDYTQGRTPCWTRRPSWTRPRTSGATRRGRSNVSC